LKISNARQNQKDLNPQKVIPPALPVSLKDAIVKGNKQQFNLFSYRKCEE